MSGHVVESTKAAPDIDEVFDLSQIQPITVAQFEALPVNLRISSLKLRSCLGGRKNKRNSCANVRFKHSNPLLEPTGLPT